MEHFLRNLLTASLQGSVVILAVLLLRLILRKTPKKYICLLWLLAEIRLLLPVNIRSNLSLQPDITIPFTRLTSMKWVSALPWIWVVITCFFIVYSIVSYVKLKRQVREAVKIRGGWECDRIETAFILGFIKPQIYIPMGMSRESRKYIMEHERTHLDKGDHWIKMIGFIALALHWFNPLVWIAFLLLCSDIETACDERVVQFMELDERKAYSAALLSCSSKKRRLAASPVAFGEVSVKQRILSILNYKKPGFWISLLGVLAFFFVVICLMTTPEKAEPSEPSSTLAEAETSSNTNEPSAVSAEHANAENSYQDFNVEDFSQWGISFRVDDDRLSGHGSDVYFIQYENGQGGITTTEQYWLEKNVNGQWMLVPTIAEPQWSDNQIIVTKNIATYGYLDWTPLYGVLEPGEYRMGKNFYCNHYLGIREQTFYSEFTINPSIDSASPEAAAAVERCYNAFEELTKRDHIHFKSQTDETDEIWMNNGHFLWIREFGNDLVVPENNGRIDIYARWDGIGYSQVRADPEDWGSEVIGMQLSVLDVDRAVTTSWEVGDKNLEFSFWEACCGRNNKTASFPEGIGIIRDDMVSFLLSWPIAGSSEGCKAQLTYKFDESGNLTYMDYIMLSDGIFTDEVEEPHFWVEIYDTSPEEIDAKIKPYTEDLIVGSFSWEEATAKYTDAEFNIREENFINNGGTPITGPVEAARLALKEYPDLGEYLSLDVYRDEAAGMWKVTVRSYVDYQATYAYRDIYLTDDGATKLLVYEGPVLIRK